jgi:hypothetical protein
VAFALFSDYGQHRRRSVERSRRDADFGEFHRRRLGSADGSSRDSAIPLSRVGCQSWPPHHH